MRSSKFRWRLASWCAFATLLLVWIISAAYVVAWLGDTTSVWTRGGMLYVTVGNAGTSSTYRGWSVHADERGIRFGLRMPYIGKNRYESSLFSIELPWWLPTLLFLGITIVAQRRGGSPEDGKNVCSCGYNLNGNTSGICPECGTPINEPVSR